MRIRTIELRCFGRFSNRAIALPDERGIHVLYGPNEAGKSTILDAITYTLHGMPQGASKEPTYAFEHATTKLRTGLELVDDDGNVIHVVRKRGNKSTVLDPKSDSASDALAAKLDGLLRGVPKDVWVNKHGLDRQRLRAGAKAMLDGKGSAEDALVAASGVVIVRQVLREIRERREALLKGTGRSGQVSEAVSELADATKAIKQAGEAARRVDADIAERTRREGERDRSAAKLRAVDGEVEQLDALVEALGVLLEREQLREKAAAIVLPPFAWERVDSDELAAVTRELEESAATLRRLEAKRAELATKLESLTADPRLADAHEQASALSQRVEKVRDAREGLPLLQAQARTQHEALERALGAIDVDAGSDAEAALAAVESLPTTAQRADLASRADAGARLVERLEDEGRRVRGAERELQDTERALQELGDAAKVDAGRLNALIETAAAINLDRFRTLRESASTRRAALEHQASSLPRCEVDLAGARSMALPAQADVAALVARLTGLEQELASAQADLANARDKRALHEAELADLLAEHEVPDPAELQVLRTTRDEAWQVIRRGLEGRSGEQLDEAAGAAPTFEQALVGADRCADELTGHGELLGQVTQLKRKLAEEDERIPRYEARLTQATAERDALLATEWRELWAAAGIEAGSVEAMAELVSRIDDVRTYAASLETDEDYVRSEAIRIDEVARELADPLGAPIADDAPAVEATRFEALVNDAKARRDQALAIERDRANRGAAVDAAKRALQTATRDRDELQAALEAWQGEWREHVAQLSLPADATTDMALARIAEVDGAVALAETLRTTLQAQEQATLLVAEFDGAVAALVEQLGDSAGDVEGLAPDALLTRICRAIDDARATSGQHDDCHTQLGQLDDELAELRASREEVERRSARLDERSGGISREELVRHDAAWQAHAALLAQVDALDTKLMHDTRMRVQDLVALRGDSDAADLRERRAALDSRRGELKGELEELQAGLNELSERIGAVMNSDELATAQQRRADAIARLEQLLPEYRQLALQEHLLERFLAEATQGDLGPLLTRASDYFARLTCGDYLRLATEVDDAGAMRVLGVRPDASGEGVESVTVDGMSEGTRDQLFLALRLAKLVLDAEAGGECMPLVVDDLLLTFDDERSAATLELLVDVSEHMQVIFLTHHQHLVDLATSTVPADRLGIVPLVESLPAAK